MDSTDPRPIVVGVDGSPASRAALRWAVRRAVEQGGTVTAVEVTLPTQLAPGRFDAVQPYGTAPPRDRAGTRSRLRQLVQAVREAVPDAPTVVQVRAVGEPGRELARAAERAAMLVVGRSRHRRVTESVLGTVAADCLRHAQCPVVLIAVEDEPG